LGYTFNGDAPVGGLVPLEADLLVLGHLIHQDSMEASADDRRQERRQRVSGRKQRARQQYVETGAVT